MSKEVNIIQKRSESLQRLLNAPGRAKDKPPFWEKMINKFPIHRPFIYHSLLRMAGIKVGKNVRFLGRLKIKLRGKPENIIIGDNVVLGNNVDIRNRENGKIILHDRVYLDNNVRIVAARDGKVEIDIGTELGAGTVINSGGETTIGKFCMIAGSVQINAQNHKTNEEQYIKEQAYEFGKISISSDVWIGSHSSVVMNTNIGEGAIVGANSLAKGIIKPFSICVGSPAKVIKCRN